MGLARLAVYLTGLILVVGAAWVFMTRTEVGASLPAGIALAIILLLVGIGVMASARNLNDRTETRRVVREGGPAPGAPLPGDREVVRERDVVYDERRYE